MQNSVRVAALYHDVGKSLNAPFFVENQADGVNPHDEMGDPYRSADIIIGHVTEGDKLARQNRLPMRLRDFIREHHGTTRVEYFYQQASQMLRTRTRSTRLTLRIRDRRHKAEKRL